MSQVPQHFLITVQRMCTSDEADLVSQWSAVVEETNLPNITLSDAALLTGMALKDCPLAGIRPMTMEEIEAWRKAERSHE